MVPLKTFLPSHSLRLLLLPPALASHAAALSTMLSLEPRLLSVAKQLSPALRKKDFIAGKEKGKRHSNADSQTRWDGVR